MKKNAYLDKRNIFQIGVFMENNVVKKAIALLFAMTVAVMAQNDTETEAGIDTETDSPEWTFEKDSIEAERLAKDFRLDFDEHYANLIRQEEKNISHSTKLSILGGTLMGFGGLMTVIYLNDGIDSDGQETLKESLKVESLIFSIGLTAIGAFGLTYNLYDLYNKNGYYQKRDAYKRAYDVYKRRREAQGGPKLVLVPTVDIEGSGAGLNAILLF